MNARTAIDRRREPDPTHMVLRPVAAMLLVGVLLYLTIAPLLDRATRNSIRDHAKRSATEWVEGTVSELPDLARLMATGQPTATQSRILEERFSSGDVFMMKIFDLDGNERYVSHTAETLGLVLHDHAVNPTSVARADVADVRIYDGRNEPGHPDTYVEAYVPFSGRDGQKWVIEVHVDVSQLAGSLRRQLGQLAVYFVIGGFLVYLAPATVLIWRTRQLRRRDLDLLVLSQRDPLTGIRNRAAAALEFDRILIEMDNRDDGVILFYLDVDHFKSINDTMGHAAGDEMLKKLAAVMTDVAGPSDAVARFGGDEFVLIAGQAAGRQAQDIAERIIAGVAGSVGVSGQGVKPGVSIGRHVVRAGESFDQALRAADAALYEAKTAGRGQFVLHSEALSRRNARRALVEHRIRDALAARAFYLEYQPIYCGKAESLLGFEALVRLTAEDGSFIPPAEFIPVAEDIGVIRELGAFVLGHAMTVASDWPEEVFIAINVSALQFGDGRFPGLVEAELKRSGMTPSRLELELTESVFISGADTHVSELAELKALGVRLALDDFGTGYSSLAYLWRFPFDKLKVDRAFLEGFEYDGAKYREFIATIVLLGHRLGMRVTAEGVETTDQLAMLETVGVEEYQGYLLGRPLPELIAIDYAHRRPPPALMVLDS